jgi:LysM repeat protein
MDLKRIIRTSALLLLSGLVLVGLASCQLPASEGPQSTEPPSGFPLPGSTATTGVIDVSIFATQTARAKPPVASPTEIPNIPAPTATMPAPTRTSSVPTATSATITYVTATPGGPPATYTLAEGEFPYCIARRFNVSLTELLNLNDLTLESLLSPGQELKIPQTGNPFEGERVLHEHPTTYTVQAGDNLNRIACYFGDVSPDMIALQNNLTSNPELQVGEKLVIP